MRGLDCPGAVDFVEAKPQPTTRQRIAEGIRRYVLGAGEPFIVTYYGLKSTDDFRGQDMGRPLPTQTTMNRFGLVAPVLMTNTTVRSVGLGVGTPSFGH